MLSAAEYTYLLYYHINPIRCLPKIRLSFDPKCFKSLYCILKPRYSEEVHPVFFLFTISNRMLSSKWNFLKFFSPYIVLVRYIKILVIMGDEIYILAKSSLKSSENSILVQTFFLRNKKSGDLRREKKKSKRLLHRFTL